MGPLLKGSSYVSGSSLARKLGIKLLQRLALTFMEPRLAPWRYCKQTGLDLGHLLSEDYRAGSAGGREGGLAHMIA